MKNIHITFDTLGPKLLPLFPPTLFFLLKSAYFPSSNALKRPIEAAFYMYKQVFSACTHRVCMLGHIVLLSHSAVP